MLRRLSATGVCVRKSFRVIACCQDQTENGAKERSEVFRVRLDEKHKTESQRSQETLSQSWISAVLGASLFQERASRLESASSVQVNVNLQLGPEQEYTSCLS